MNARSSGSVTLSRGRQARNAESPVGVALSTKPSLSYTNFRQVDFIPENISVSVEAMRVRRTICTDDQIRFQYRVIHQCHRRLLKVDRHHHAVDTNLGYGLSLVH